VGNVEIPSEDVGVGISRGSRTLSEEGRVLLREGVTRYIGTTGEEIVESRETTGGRQIERGRHN
jgi:hypothetical protein